jgi:hypothetical protein
MATKIKRSTLAELTNKIRKEHADQIEALPFKKNQRLDIAAGFTDGSRSMWIALRDAGIIEIEED